MLKAREEPAHRFQLETEVAANLRPGHAQHEFGRRVASCAVTLRQIDQERRQALLGAHAAQLQHDGLVTGDLARQELVQISLQRRYPAPEVLELVERKDAIFAI